ncbi:MAG: ribonuclease HII [Proteobacteria bacterium]|nr:ribonuclease HII [Pseudomonadota bacterium]
MQPSFLIENNYPNLLVCGFDEAGRGPLAGPVVAACAILNPNNFPKEINDSKKLSKSLRFKVFSELKNVAKFGVGIVDEKVIDKINILEATKLAMLQAYFNLSEKYQVFPQIILVDGNFLPFAKRDKIVEISAIVKGDQKSLSIAAASIIAKETRDQIMRDLDQKYPQFGFAKHAGYATKFHVEQIHKYGFCEFHRKSFEPIKSMFSVSS